MNTMTIDQFLISASIMRQLFTGKMAEADVLLLLEKLGKGTEPHLIALGVVVCDFIQDNLEMFPYLEG